MAEVSAAPDVPLAVELEPVQLVAPDGTPTAEDRYTPRSATRNAELALRADGRHARPRHANSSTCNARASWRCSRRAAARRPPRSARRRACARPTGCSRNTARSARSCCAASRRPRWVRCGGASGTAGSGSPRSAAPRSSIPDRHPRTARGGRGDGRPTAGRGFGDASRSSATAPPARATRMRR